MIVDTLPEWLIPTTISVEGLKIVIASQVNLKEKQVSFIITTSGWLTKASGQAACSICTSVQLRAERVKKEKETIARMAGWTIEGDIDSNQPDRRTEEEEEEVLLLAS